MTNLVGILCGDKNFKRVLFSVIFFFLSVIFFLSSTLSVLAQGGGADSGQAGNNPSFPIGGPGTFPVPGSGGTGGGSVTPGSGPGGSGGGGGDLVPAGGTQTEPLPNVELGEIEDPILKVLHAIVVSGLGWLVGMFGYLFDFAVNYFIIGFGDQFINYNVGSTVNELWATVRDIFNLTFIFGLVYIGFKMILDSSDSSARKMLISLIGAALLVNFSLFITKFVVDFSNIAAFQVYRAMSGSGPEGTFSITEAFMTIMGIRSIMGVDYIESGVGGYQYIIGFENIV
jgi:hypothetical protein